MASNGMLARYKKRKAPPNGWEEVSTVMEALEDEMKRGRCTFEELRLALQSESYGG